MSLSEIKGGGRSLSNESKWWVELERRLEVEGEELGAG